MPVISMLWRDWVRGIEIEPSLYAADFANLGTQLGRLLDAGARLFHFDVGDGRFVEPITMGPIVLESIAPLIHQGGGAIDCHLMVVEPQKHFRQIARAGGDSVTFHVEACDDPVAAITAARELGLGVGLALNPETAVERVLAAADSADLVNCMSIHPGYSGQEFMPAALPRIAALRSRLPDEVLVQVDGGIEKDNAGRVAEAGAELLVAGTSVFEQPDIGAAYLNLAKECTTQPAGRRL
jgi:ribulose-phosphate 3-epimerase